MFSSMRRNLLQHKTPGLSLAPYPPAPDGGTWGEEIGNAQLSLLLSLSFLYASCLPDASSPLALRARAAWDQCVTVCIHQGSTRKRFITRNWLMQLWELTRQIQNSQGRLSGHAGNSGAGADAVIHGLNCSFLRETSVLLLKSFQLIRPGPSRLSRIISFT